VLSHFIAQARGSVHPSHSNTRGDKRILRGGKFGPPTAERPEERNLAHISEPVGSATVRVSIAIISPVAAAARPTLRAALKPYSPG